MAEALAGHGYAVDVLCLQLPGQAAEEWVNGVRVLRLPEARHQGAGAGVYLREYVRFFGLAWRGLVALHRQQPYALVQVYNPPDPLVFCTLPLKRRGVPVVLDLRELMPELFMSRFRLARGSVIVRLLTWLERRACAYADAVIVLHEPHRQIMLGRGMPAGKMTQVMNCPDERWFGAAPVNSGVAVQSELKRRHPERSGVSFCGAQSKDAVLDDARSTSFDCIRHTTPDSAQDAPLQSERLSGGSGAVVAIADTARPFVAIYHGAILERYGVDLLVRAAAQALDQASGLRLEIYGTGDFLPAVQALAAELGLGDAVHFHGQRPLEEMRAAIAAADVGVVPMRQDVFTYCILPTKLLEYVAVGIPAIAAATATTAAYFDETTVQLFRPGDVADLAAKLVAVYRDPAAAADQAERARAFTARHNWQGERERYLALVGGVMRGA